MSSDDRLIPSFQTMHEDIPLGEDEDYDLMLIHCERSIVTLYSSTTNAIRHQSFFGTEAKVRAPVPS